MIQPQELSVKSANAPEPRQERVLKITAASGVLQKEDGPRQDLKDQAERGT